jgi:hypothetical protein
MITQEKIEAAIAESGKTSITDMVSYATYRFPTADKATIKAAAKYIKSTIPKNYR